MQGKSPFYLQPSGLLILAAALFVLLAGCGPSGDNDRRASESPAEAVFEEVLETAVPEGLKVLSFPEDRSLGALKIGNPAAWNPSIHWWWGNDTGWQDLAPAKGRVTVPAGAELALFVEPEGWKDLAPLRKLLPADVEMIRLVGKDASNRPDDASLAHIASLSGLRELYIENTSITNAGLEPLQHLQSLIRFRVSMDVLSETGASHIARLPSLRTLRLTSGSGISAGDLERLSRLDALEELFLERDRIENEGLAHLAKMTALRNLTLQFGNLNGAGIAHLRAMPSLKELTLLGTELPSDDLARLANLFQLESLYLNQTLSDEDLARLKLLLSLRRLSLHTRQLGERAALTDEGLAHLKEIQSLETVELLYGDFSDAGLAHLAQLPNLQNLIIPNCRNFTDAGLAHLAAMPNLQFIRIRGTHITDEGLQHLEGLKSLKALVLWPSSQVTEQGAARLEERIPGLQIIRGTPTKKKEG